MYTQPYASNLFNKHMHEARINTTIILNITHKIIIIITLHDYVLK